MSSLLNDENIAFTYEPPRLTSLKHERFHPYITGICSIILIVTRMAFADLISRLPRRRITVTPGFLNNIFSPSSYSDDLLRVWNEELTEVYGIQPIKVTENLHNIYDDYYVVTCDISLKLNDNINRIFLKHNASVPNFVVNLDCDDADQPTRPLRKSQLHDLQWVELKNRCILEQLTLAQWNEIFEDLQREYLFTYLRYDSYYFNHY